MDKIKNEIVGGNKHRVPKFKTVIIQCL